MTVVFVSTQDLDDRIQEYQYELSDQERLELYTAKRGMQPALCFSVTAFCDRAIGSFHEGILTGYSPVVQVPEHVRVP